ncbi:MAG: glycosyltransferase family 39 protein [Anaerolineae bacterium]|nr:glycosyltransferase family 39 protein [Anaerolineae bacterium]
MIPYWIADTLSGLPIYLLVVAGVGIPWAFALLPRAERGDLPTLLAAALAAGGGLITAWMFILGTVGEIVGEPLLRAEGIAIGLAVLGLGGALLAWRGRWTFIAHSRATQRRATQRVAPTGERLAFDERWLILLIALAVLVALVVIMYWPFTAYDALWVYGYEARVYALTGRLPNSIDYYPQFLPLLYTLGQINGVSDHAARAVVPLLHVGAILAAYVLGRLVDSRRTGVYLAALWTLYPHVGEWSRAGDLEIPLTFSFTLAAAFFLKAWFDAGSPATSRRDRLRHAALSGAAFGVALWTKPTAGAFALGVALMTGLEAMRAVGQGHRRLTAILAALRPRLEIAAITALTCAPLGGIWYVRNLLLGHNAVDFPPGYWQTVAERGGDDLGFPLLAILVCTVSLWVRFGDSRRAGALVGLGLLGAAAARSILVPDLSLEERRLTLAELTMLAAGGALLFKTLIIDFLNRTDAGRALLPLAARLGWAAALAAPYFIVWFLAYSYHYRLSFAVIPLLLLPVAVVLGRGIGAVAPRHRLLKPALLFALGAAALPGIVSPVADKFSGSAYLFSDIMPDDDARYRSGNAALMTVVDGLRVWKEENPGERLTVSAPGVDNLPFFFPLDDIRVEDAPTRLAALEDAVYFVYGLSETRGEYESVAFFENQVINALGRQDIVRRAWGHDDGIFKYDVYELHLNRRWRAPEPMGAASDEVIFGGFAGYLGYDLGGLELWTGRRVIMHLYFETLATPSADYSIYVHLRRADGSLIAAWDNPAARTETGYYSTLLWEPGEYITEERVIALPDGAASLGEGYRLVIGFYDSANNRLPVIVNGTAAGDGYEIDNRIAIVPPRD